MKIKNKRTKKNKKIRIAMRNLVFLYNNYPENRNFLFPELEDEKISAS